MTIASKLFFLQRPRAGRSSPPDETDLGPLSSPRRPKARSSSGDHRRLVSSHSGKIPISNRLQNSRHILVNDEVHRSKDDLEERLPNSVRQARERLVLRLRGVNISTSRETDIDLSNQLIMCQSQPDVAPFNCESTKTPIPDISHAIHGLKCVIFRAANECEIMGTSFGECSICLEKFLEGDELAQLNCKHAFHSRCLMWWVPAHSNCPYCRTPVA
ncbi:putative E3 ubiquitin-protein ligase RHY1A [Carex rostrata]